ncbi:hypothetical protein ILUMI_05968 [Ignelater luminosus]|uniref:Peptidase aspartic putative domain-containing protein n=1 Tax=Ignelater luminosus TaxID=2038154 RepID=A0A8K0DB94_IGNLU|nr:hypothetical protein ILUMI_05968 [Ignelater luminosus]
MGKLEQYKAQLEIIENKVKKIEDYVKSFKPASSINQLKARLTIIADSRKEFEEVQFEIEQLDKETSMTEHTKALKTHSTVSLLSAAVVLIKNAKNEFESCRALLDVGSMSHYITQSMYNHLGLNPSKANIEIRGLNGTVSSVNRKIDVKIKSRYSAFEADLNCLVVTEITENLPLVSLNLSSVEIPKNLRLADPEFYSSSHMDLLIGAGLFLQLLCVGQGGFYNNSANILGSSTACNLSLQQQVENFWALENPVMGSNEPLNLTTEEIACENHFRKNTIRDDAGRFIVKLPIKNDKLDIADTRGTALKRFFSLERNLSKDPQKKREYLKFISEYRELNHMELMTQLPSDSQSVYLSHHAVVNENSTTSRLRVVFDASEKSFNNRSLNDNLMAGPVIQQNLFSIILRFRTFQYVLPGDITKCIVNFGSVWFLKLPEEFWPESQVNVSKANIPDKRIALPMTVIPKTEMPVLTKFSSYGRLQRVIA